MRPHNSQRMPGAALAQFDQGHDHVLSAAASIRPIAGTDSGTARCHEQLSLRVMHLLARKYAGAVASCDVTEDGIIRFVAGLSGVDVATASEAHGAPDVAWVTRSSSTTQTRPSGEQAVQLVRSSRRDY